MLRILQEAISQFISQLGPNVDSSSAEDTRYFCFLYLFFFCLFFVNMMFVSSIVTHSFSDNLLFGS